MATTTLSQLDVLEAESIHIFREVVSEAARPAMLYSDRERLFRHAPAGAKGLLPRPYSLSFDTYRYRLQVPGDDRVSRSNLP